MHAVSFYYRRPPLLARPPPPPLLARPPPPLLKLLLDRPLLPDENELERELAEELLRTEDEPVDRPLLLLTDDERVGVEVVVARRVVVVVPLPFTVAELLRPVLPSELIFVRPLDVRVEVRLFTEASILLRRVSVLSDVLRPVVLRVVEFDERADEARAPAVARRESDDDER
jgi:hypothetical protein